MRNWSAAACLVAGWMSLSGCSGGSDRPELAQVSGTVTFKGERVADADVSFTPQNGGRPAYGRTNAQGEFQLTTFEPNDGAVLGQHVVTVRKEVPKDGAKDASNPYQEYKSVLPAKFANPQQTPLRTEVVKAGTKAELVLSE